MKPAIHAICAAFSWLYKHLGCFILPHEFYGWKTGIVGKEEFCFETCVHCDKRYKLNEETWDKKYD